MKRVDSQNEIDKVWTLSNGMSVTFLAYSAAENFLISGSDDGIVRVWNASAHNIFNSYCFSYISYHLSAVGTDSVFIIYSTLVNTSTATASIVEESKGKRWRRLKASIFIIAKWHGMWWRSHIGHEGKGGVRYSWLTYTSLSKMNGG
ncbi:WD domain, G-beta repeat protein [Medicago truncatula]|uniref:WD domain, G-beta repeat protein n=1 Tax=Medicago truncatula TaxID=3880 RepID=G7KR47_MEDTR|nr:WD domain, G-beta repeat protein [Medicago truncatula]